MSEKWFEEIKMKKFVPGSMCPFLVVRRDLYGNVKYFCTFSGSDECGYVFNHIVWCPIRDRIEREINAGHREWKPKIHRRGEIVG